MDTADCMPQFPDAKVEIWYEENIRKMLDFVKKLL